EIREREFAVMDMPSSSAAASAAAVPPSVVDDAIEPLETGFYAISGAAAAADGTLYFVDRHQHRIFSWSKARGLEVVRHDALDPVSVAVDKSGSLLVQSSDGPEGSVYSFTPGTPADRIVVLQPQASATHTGAAAVLPGNMWDNGRLANP